MKKKIISAALSLCVALGLTVIPVSAEPEDYYREGYYTYEITDGAAKITFVDRSISGDITIPSTLGGYPVAYIGDNAFETCTGLTSVTIPAGITFIGNRTFYWCSSLISIDVDIANKNYSSENGVLYNKDKTELIHFPNSKEGDYVIPNSVTIIGDEAFYRCKSLTGVTIPDSVTSIGHYAFANCTGLTSITIPANLQHSGDDVFGDCTSLTSVTIPSGITSIGNGMFVCCTGLTSVTIPDSVTSIGHSAFAICTGLTSVNIPDSVTSIETQAFFGCYNLTSVNIPDSVTYIGCGAFWQTSYFNYESNRNADFLYIGNHLINVNNKEISGNFSIKPGTICIAGGSFEDCKNLTSITITDSVASIGSETFVGCDSLTDIYYTGSEEDWKKTRIGVDNPNLSNVTIHYNFVSETPISTVVNEKDDKKEFTVSLMDLPKGNTVFLALYKNGNLTDMLTSIYEGEDLVFTSDKEFNSAMVIVWKGSKLLKLLTKVE